jgi:hypothetical protein
MYLGTMSKVFARKIDIDADVAGNDPIANEAISPHNFVDFLTSFCPATPFLLSVQKVPSGYVNLKDCFAQRRMQLSSGSNNCRDTRQNARWHAAAVR